ncbi:hypothetical protein CUMW_275050 [Citrus unshiu]|uniref:Uncharacterized protein n=1 Tax=Citrus unshiu TaxID=55188 RepID=A0A2H5MZK5_CITUN|nr:hypothetical protein CUMW_275050 [Citrus unshiu]
MNLCASIDGIFNNLSVPFNKVKAKSASYMAADLVSVGDSWLSFAIKNRLIEPIAGAEDQDWFKCLSHKWKVTSLSLILEVKYGRHRTGGAQRSISLTGNNGIPERVYKLNDIIFYKWFIKLCRCTQMYTQINEKLCHFDPKSCRILSRILSLNTVNDWKDPWQPELAGRISMVNSPREVIGSVLKYRVASYNSNDIDSQVAGGKIAVQQNLALLANQEDSRCNHVDPGKFDKVLVWRSEIGLCNSGAFQVRLFDSTHYLKAFAIGDVWVAVGWISDVLPAVKHMSNVAVVVPKSGASCLPFYFDIHIVISFILAISKHDNVANKFAIPAASRLETKQIGGRVRARFLPCKQEVIPGASPSALESTLVKLPEELLEGKPSLDTNLIAGVLPAEILARCEFLEPLSEATLSDYEWLVVNLQKPAPVLMKRVQHYLSSLI